MDIDRQRIAAVCVPEGIGYTWRGAEWQPPAATPPWTWSEPDALHAALVRRADAIANCAEGSEEEAELRTIADVLEAYEAKRWLSLTRRTPSQA
jgi:hypothetical protein